MNVWDNILVIQVVYDLIYQEQLNSNISNFNSLCIICVGDSKLRIRNYKNFLIYFTNHYYLIDITDETNLTFEKLSRKIEILLQDKDSIKRKIAKSARKDVKDIFETIRLSRKPKISFTDTVFIIIEVTYGTEVFENVRNIEITYQVTY